MDPRTGKYLSEAHCFWRMCQRGELTIEKARKEIGASTYERKKILHHFDRLAGVRKKKEPQSKENVPVEHQ